MSHRVERLNNLIQEEVSLLLHKEVEFGLGILVTVTRAEVSIDTAHAKVYISVLPQKHTGKVVETLRKNIYRLQQVLNKELRFRPVPKIEFVVDKSIDTFEHVEKIIEDLEHAEESSE